MVTGEEHSSAAARMGSTAFFDVLICASPCSAGECLMVYTGMIAHLQLHCRLDPGTHHCAPQFLWHASAKSLKAPFPSRF